MDGRRLTKAVLFVTVMMATVWAPPAAARHNLSMLRVSPDLSAPGAEVAVSGFSYTRPVSIHFNAIDGPVLGTFTPDSNSDLRGSVRIPEDAKPGRYVLFATQDDTGKPTRLPARALLTVAGSGGAPIVGRAATPEPRVAGLVRQHHDTSGGALLLAGLAGAAVAMLGVGAALLVAGRRASKERAAS